MSEPMVSHDCVAFYLLSEDVSQSVKVVQSGQGADEVLGGYDWYPPLAGVAARRRGGGVRAVFFDRRWSAMSSCSARTGCSTTTRRPPSSAERFGRPGAETAVDAALRNDTTVMLVDDPVKRVDNMTMAWGLEARVPFLDHELVELAGRIPPELKLADGGKGVLKRASRGVVPDEVIDRTKGYFPVPAIRQLEGPYLDRVRDALTDPAARRAACSAARRCADARRPEHHPDDARLQRAVAAGAAGDVAAAPWRRLSRAPPGGPRHGVATGPEPRRARPTGWSTPGAAGDRRCPRTAGGSPSSATAAGSPASGCRTCPAAGAEPREPTHDRALRRPGGRGELVGRRRLAGLLPGHRRRRPHPGLGGPPRRERRPADRRRGRTSTPSSGPWTRSGHRVVVTIPGEEPDEPTGVLPGRPGTGELTPLAAAS